ncbi:MAG: glutathione S-transferase family protein [Polyangiales bacterium]
MSSTLLYFAPRSRALTALWLLEELGVPYTREDFSLSTGRHKQPDFLALNPMGKVPLVVDDGVAVSEVGAIAVYLADKYRATPLSPALDHPDRAAFLRWCFFSSGVMEPAYGEKFFKWTVPASSVAWGSFDAMLATLTEGVARGPYLLGETFSAADVLVGATARFGQLFGVLPKEGPTADYVARISARPALVRALAIEAEVLARLTPPA